VGGNGTILHTSTGGEITANRSIVSLPLFNIYPNPAEEDLYTESKSPILSASFIEATGREFQVTASSTNKEGLFRFHLPELGGSLYWLKIQTKEGVSVQMVVKR